MSKLLFEYPWLPRVFEMSKETGLDWLRMSAIALLLSEGDPRKRVIDYVFMQGSLGPESPLFAAQYDTEQRADIDLIDRSTRWGLFQLHGQVAVESGFSGRLINLIDIGANTRIACALLVEALKTREIQDAERYVFEVDPAAIDEVVGDLKQSIELLTQIGMKIILDQEEQLVT